MIVSRNLFGFAAVLLAGTLLCGCVDKGRPVDGARVFADNCVVCHGEQADGTGPAAADIPQGVPDLRQIANRNRGRFPRNVVRKIIDGRTIMEAHRSPTMPTWAEDFAGDDGDDKSAERRVNEQIDALVDYLAEIQIRD